MDSGTSFEGTNESRDEKPSVSPDAVDALVRVKMEEEGVANGTQAAPQETLRPKRSPASRDETPSSDAQMGASRSSSVALNAKDEADPIAALTPASAVPAPVARPKKRAAPANAERQLIGDLPIATADAHKTFEELDKNVYQYQTLGRSREAMEGMTCECQYQHGVDDPSMACGDDADCINRLTQVECLPSECRCRGHCKNQRFRKKEYAPIDIVLTEKKGFGLRAAGNIPKDGFIYEYVGEVVSHPSFMKRMRAYAAEGLKHFYFMMLQKDEYLDATKKGGIGRFANHSCNPNCYVAKWTVGNHVRMGIFASRAIRKDEELTFNYNVDRYGHEAQPCYCGEPNCVGFLGGKTQTDLGGMDTLFLDALGITDEVEVLGLKGSKKKKGKKLDEDYVPVLHPFTEKEAPKLVQAVRQTTSRKVLVKLLTRIGITEDVGALRQLMRLRMFSVMTNVLDDYREDAEICVVAMDAMRKWPLLVRNKVEDSKVNVPVQAFADSSTDEKLKAAAQQLIAHWATLETAYRIPKRVQQEGDEPASPPQSSWVEERHAKRQRQTAPRTLTLNPNNLHFTDETTDEQRELRRRKREEDIRDKIARDEEARNKAAAEQETRERAARERAAAQRIAAVIAMSDIVAAAQAEREAAIAAQAAQAAKEAKEQERRERRAARTQPTAEEREQAKEKQLQKLVSAIVVKCLSKHRSKLDSDAFKKHARELTQIIAEKEKKSSSFKDNRLDSLSEEKTVKIKKFAKEYIAKVLRKLQRSASGSSSRRKSGHERATRDPRAGPSTVGGSSSTPTPVQDDDDEDEDVAGDDDAELDLEAGMASPHEPLDAKPDASPEDLDGDRQLAVGRASPDPGRPELTRSESGDVEMREAATPVTPMDVDSPAPATAALPPKPTLGTTVPKHPLPARPSAAFAAVTLTKPMDPRTQAPKSKLSAWFPDGTLAP